MQLTSQTIEDVLYPKIEAHTTGFLEVTELHTIAWERSGNPDGIPVIVIHGGPGGGSQPSYRRYFDSNKFDIIQFDQRGCGQSTPYAELNDNNTQASVSDLEMLRQHFGIDTWHVFGGSWGSTLALIYAQSYPGRVQSLVLRGIFMCRKSELHWFYQDGASHIFPDAFARIECHYFINAIFVEEAYILNHVAKIANIPTVIVQGRYDVVCPAKSAWELHKALPNSNLIIVPDAGHSMGEVSIARELVITTDKI
jgi:pimeloyl-ACP methyl ester carboxylesterase